MMEFTFSRVTLSICGVVLLAAVLAPVLYVFEESADRGVQNIADKTAVLIDRFERSDADTMTLSFGDVLPGPQYSVTLDGNMLTVDNGKKTFTAGMVTSVSGGTFGYMETVEFVRTSDGLTVTSLT